jgi:hypothetical protein
MPSLTSFIFLTEQCQVISSNLGMRLPGIDLNLVLQRNICPYEILQQINVLLSTLP